MSYFETKVTIKMYVARCDVCGACAGEPAASEVLAMRIAEKRWGFKSMIQGLTCGAVECVRNMSARKAK